MMDTMSDNKSPFVFMILGLIVLLLGIQAGGEVVSGITTALAAATATTWADFLEFILQFVPVLYYVGIMTIAGGLGVYAASSVGNPIITLIYGIILLLIGVQAIPTVVTSVDAAITAAASLPFLSFLLPFVPVMYVVSLLAIAVALGTIVLRDVQKSRS